MPCCTDVCFLIFWMWYDVKHPFGAGLSYVLAYLVKVSGAAFKTNHGPVPISLPQGMLSLCRDLVQSRSTFLLRVRGPPCLGMAVDHELMEVVNYSRDYWGEVGNMMESYESYGI